MCSPEGTSESHLITFLISRKGDLAAQQSLEESGHKQTAAPEEGLSRDPLPNEIEDIVQVRMYLKFCFSAFAKLSSWHPSLLVRV